MRRRAGLTVPQLAEKMGCTCSAIYFWEAGRYWPKAEYLPRIAEILGCTIDELFTDPNEEHTPEKEERP
jgi:DNA-binding helix-turn-helix protein